MARRVRKRTASTPWTIDAAGGTAEDAYADMYTGIEMMIGDTATVTGGGTGGIIATDTENGSLAEIQRAAVAQRR